VFFYYGPKMFCTFFFNGHEIFLGLNIYMLFFNDINKSNPRKYITDKKNPYPNQAKRKKKEKKRELKIQTLLFKEFASILIHSISKINSLKNVHS